MGMKNKEYFDCLTENLKVLVDSYECKNDGFGNHFAYTYKNQNCSLSLINEKIAIFKKNGKNNYLSNFLSERNFHPSISTSQEITDYNELLDKIDLEVSSWN